MKSIQRTFKILSFLAILSINLSSCLLYKDILNFQDGQDLDKGKVDSILNYVPIRIKPDDVIMVVVGGYNIEEAEKFNIADMRTIVRAGGGGGGGQPTEPLGYRVGPNGKIDMPIVGELYIKDLTMDELKELVYKKVEETKYLTDFTVEVRFLTFKVTILGEVNSPGTYVINNTKISALEAIGMSRDLSVFSNRDNVLVIRESEGKRTYGRLNFKTTKVFESPYYYLQPNDIVYVEPHKAKILSTPDPLTRYLGTIIALASFIILLSQL